MFTQHRGKSPSPKTRIWYPRPLCVSESTVSRMIIVYQLKVGEIPTKVRVSAFLPMQCHPMRRVNQWQGVAFIHKPVYLLKALIVDMLADPPGESLLGGGHIARCDDKFVSFGVWTRLCDTPHCPWFCLMRRSFCPPSDRIGSYLIVCCDANSIGIFLFTLRTTAGRPRHLLSHFDPLPCMTRRWPY